jgi:uncharacterized protein YmfQ (DUF2313 family)
MARPVSDFVTAMLALLPEGLAWPKSPDSNFAMLCEVMAEEFRGIELRNEQLLAEMSPATTSLLFNEREAEFGLPGACITEEQSLTQRRNAMVAKHKLVGEQSKQFFIDTATTLGYDITITEYQASDPGPQTEYNGHTLVDDAWNFVWQINAELETSTPMTFGSPFGSPFTAFGNELLECTMRSIAHGHRALFFSYT